MNLPAVAEALHVTIPDGGWSVCAGAPFNYKRTMKDERTTIYPALIGKIQVHIYNGEADACVPHSDNEWWTSSMGLKVVNEWEEFDDASGVLAGYTKTYASNFTYTSVLLAGHM